MKKRLLSFVLVVLMIASLLPATALAADIVDSGTCGAEGDGSNLTWTLDSDGVLTISGSGDMHGYGPSGAPWHGRVKSAVIAEGVTSIGGFAFYDCTSLTSVTIPDSVTSIGANAFFDCTSLTSVTIPDSVTSIGVGAFASCTSLTGIWVAESNSHYSSDASGVLFNKDKTTLVQCPGAFAAYTIPNSVTSIGDVAFSFCTSLASVTIPDSVTSIGRHAFQYCTSLTSVTIPNGVTSIGDSAFSYCASLTSVTIPDSVTSIGWSAFAGCTSLTSVTIPDSVTSIGSLAFSGCTSLTSVTVPDSVTSIGDAAFASCTSLTGIWVAEGSSHYASDASGVLFNKDKTTLVQCPGAFSGSYAIPDSVTSIGHCAFEDCASLTSVTIPDSVTSIGAEAFYNCKSLTSVTIPDSVTSIGDFTFSYCESLTSVTIPDSVTSIGHYAFEGCRSLTDVYFTGTESAWNSIAIGAANDALKNANIHYNYVSHTHSYKDVVTAPTCTTKGYTTHTCACGDSYVDAYVDALGHAWDNGKVTKEPTETESGVKTFTCTRCGETKTETIPKLTHEHSYKAVVTAPTCTSKGYTTHTCACGDSYVDAYVDALGHAWDNGKVTKEPTETESGVKTFTCTRCGETKTETIPKLTHEHSYKAVVTAPTCTSKGYTTHTCACGDSYVDAYVDALGHAWDNGKVTKEPTETETGVKTFACTRCGETKTETIPATGSDVDVTEMFSDVTKNWAYPGIQYCVTHQLMSGVGGNLFAPKMTTTRAQIVQILYNLEGEPKVSGTTPFTDLTQNWYKDAVLWAYQTGVVSGTSATTFAPDLPVTREQIAVILMEYMTRVLKLERTWTPADLSVFPDAGSVSGWAKDALADAVALGLISGASNGGQTYLNPQGSATREQVATILMNFCQNVKK